MTSTSGNVRNMVYTSAGTRAGVVSRYENDDCIGNAYLLAHGGDSAGGTYVKLGLDWAGEPGNASSSLTLSRSNITASGYVYLPSTSYVNGSLLTDFVTTTSTSGIWRYRKWKSGIKECWVARASLTCKASSWSNTSYSFPVTFSSAPAVLVTRTGSGSGTTTDSTGWSQTIEHHTFVGTSSMTLEVYQTQAATTYWGIYAIGY